MIVCQGKITDKQKNEFLDDMPQVSAKLEEMFTEGKTHPDEEDLREAAVFASNVQNVIN